MEFAGNCYDLYQPEVGSAQPDCDSEIVTIPCPVCSFKNNFWGKMDPAGFVIEHYGRQCQGYKEHADGLREICGYRFRAKFCDQCGADNDIAARQCQQCNHVLVDPDKKLRDALKLKDALIMNCIDLKLQAGKNKFAKAQLKVTYIGDDGGEINEVWPLHSKTQKRDFLNRFIRPHLIDRHRPFTESCPTKVIKNAHRLRAPKVIIARKKGRFWVVRDKLFELSE